MSDNRLLVPAAEAAKMLSIGRSTFWRLVAKNQIPPSVKFAGMTRWRVADLQQCVESLGKHQPTPP